jgi:poly-gamma-glutamate system protein
MKRLYWRPQRVSLRALFLVALVALVGLMLVEKNRIREEQPYFKEKINASRIAMKGYLAVKDEAIRQKIEINREADPSGSYLIGQLITPVTTNPGHLTSKQTTINPNFAAVVVHLLRRAGVENGDLVAVGISGSFPAMNINALAALEAIKADAIIVNSVGSSQWGANNPKFLWPEMEKALNDAHAISFKSSAISPGGLEDKALGLSVQGKRIIRRAMERSGKEVIEPESYTESVQERINIYQARAMGRPIKAYINVGGGTASVGARLGRKLFRPGLNRNAPQGASGVDSVMGHFILSGTPVVHLLQMTTLATRYGLPIAPTETPLVGQGKIFVREVHNRKLAVATLVLIVLLLYAFIRLDWGYRIFTSGRKETTATRPQKMV